MYCVSDPVAATTPSAQNAAMAANQAANSAAMAANLTASTNQGEGRVIGRPRRIVQPNRKYVGPAWTNTT